MPPSRLLLVPPFHWRFHFKDPMHVPGGVPGLGISPEVQIYCPSNVPCMVAVHGRDWAVFLPPAPAKLGSLAPSAPLTTINAL